MKGGEAAASNAESAPRFRNDSRIGASHGVPMIPKPMAGRCHAHLPDPDLCDVSDSTMERRGHLA
jgi:hypothetical protein